MTWLGHDKVPATLRRGNCSGSGDNSQQFGTRNQSDTGREALHVHGIGFRISEFSPRIGRPSRKPQAASRKPQAASRKPQAASRKPQAASRKPQAAIAG